MKFKIDWQNFKCFVGFHSYQRIASCSNAVIVWQCTQCGHRVYFHNIPDMKRKNDH